MNYYEPKMRTMYNSLLHFHSKIVHDQKVCDLKGHLARESSLRTSLIPSFLIFSFLRNGVDHTNT